MMDAFEILNEDCWRVIFKLLKPLELYKCSLVCERFDGILQAHKNEWMLELVLPSILPYLERKEPHPAPFLPKKRTWNELYKLRSVCKTWRDTIDAYMSHDSFRFNGPVAMIEDNQEFSELVWQEGPGWNRFTDNVQLAEFIETFRDTETNPFPGRKAIIYDLMEDHFDNDALIEANALARVQFRERRGELLHRFGKFLWYVQLGWNHFRQIDTSFEDEVVSSLPHLPHIRELSVGCTSRLLRADNGTWGRTNELGARLPELRDLRTLVFEIVPRALALALLIKYGPQLTQLEMTSKCNNVFFFSIPMDLFTSLRDLSITVSKVHFNSLFLALRSLPAPLENLKLELFTYGDWIRRASLFFEEDDFTPSIFGIDQLFAAIGHFPLLTTLSIVMYRGEIPKSDRLRPQNNIQTFNLKVKFSAWGPKPIHISLDFLIDLLRLTSFNLVYEYEATTKKEVALSPPGKVDVVRFREYIAENDLNLMYHSNIWEKVPSLQTFSIEFKRPQKSIKRIFTRRECQLQLARNGAASL